MTARIYVTLKPSVLDPQGQAVARSLGRLGYREVKDARIGRFIELSLDDATSPDEARARVEAMCEKLLANTVIEDYRYELIPMAEDDPGSTSSDKSAAKTSKGAR